MSQTFFIFDIDFKTNIGTKAMDTLRAHLALMLLEGELPDNAAFDKINLKAALLYHKDTDNLADVLKYYLKTLLYVGKIPTKHDLSNDFKDYSMFMKMEVDEDNVSNCFLVANILNLLYEHIEKGRIMYYQHDEDRFYNSYWKHENGQVLFYEGKVVTQFENPVPVNTASDI